MGFEFGDWLPTIALVLEQLLTDVCSIPTIHCLQCFVCLWCHWYHNWLITEDRFSLLSSNSTVPSVCAVTWYSYYLCFSYPNLKSVRELIYKRGFGKVDRRRTALSDNAVIEQVGDAECMTSSTSFLLKAFTNWLVHDWLHYRCATVFPLLICYCGRQDG